MINKTLSPLSLPLDSQRFPIFYCEKEVADSSVFFLDIENLASDKSIDKESSRCPSGRSFPADKRVEREKRGKPR